MLNLHLFKEKDYHPSMQFRFIFITGGVLSSLGKGVLAASTASLLESMGLKVAMIKLDPYINVDPGTMSPYQHGEVYVTDDGAETDLDLGHYSRYTHATLSKKSNATTGQVYDTVLKKERRGDYLGSTVQVIPHVTDEIKHRILEAATEEDSIDVTIVEVGGTVGDIESYPFLEAIRQLRFEYSTSSLNFHMTYVPYLKSSGEMKTKPTQHSVQALRQLGIVPDTIICRSDEEIDEESKRKISLFSSVPLEAVFDLPDVKQSLFEVPIRLKQLGMDQFLARRFSLPNKQASTAPWEELLKKELSLSETITIGVVGKYLESKDAYKSVFESLHHASLATGYKVELLPIEADKIEENSPIPKADGYLVMGGFGLRGIEGKISIAKHCRVNKLPYFGICLGMQIMVIEFSRNVLKLKEAHSTEMDPETDYPVVVSLKELSKEKNLGGTMRLGSFACAIEPHTLAESIYQQQQIFERHRHRYEINPKFEQMLESYGLIVSGRNLDRGLVEIMEIKEHPFMIGVQFHPEFKSKVFAPHPLFCSFILATRASWEELLG